jgi:hypothetical protein
MPPEKRDYRILDFWYPKKRPIKMLVQPKRLPLTDLGVRTTCRLGD